MRWKPAHEAHAIERVSAAVIFADQLPSKGWAALIAGLSQVLTGFGFTTQIVGGAALGGPGHQVQFVIGPGGLQTGQSEGRIFQMIDEGGVLREEIHVFRDRVVYSSTKYAGWTSFFSRYEELCEALIERYLISMAPTYVKLEYWDRFNTELTSEFVGYADLISIESRFVPGFVVDINELMHSHVGFFASAPEGHKRLININVDAVDIPPPPENAEGALRRSVGIYSFAQDQLMTARGEQFDLKALVSTFDAQHTILKAVIGDVITSEMSDRISLKGS